LSFPAGKPLLSATALEVMGREGGGRSKSGLDTGPVLLEERHSCEQEPELVRQVHQEADQDQEQHISHSGSNGQPAFGLAEGNLNRCEKRLVRRHDLLHHLGMAQLRYSEAHVWVRVEGADAVLGLSDYLRDQMGDITSLVLPDVGDILRAKRKMGHLESEEASSPIEAPISGEVIEVNIEALQNPDLVNSEPYETGWLLRVRIEDPSELDELINEEEYAELTTEV
jgi:glycine cleavage system H protein